MTYLITVHDEMSDQNLTGRFEANSLDKALDECKEVYAQELDTTKEAVDIIAFTNL
jgi:hypothetical protein